MDHVQHVGDGDVIHVEGAMEDGDGVTIIIVAITIIFIDVDVFVLDGEVWRDDGGYAGGNLVYDRKNQLLTACWSDRHSDDGACYKFQIRHGAALAPYQPIYESLPGVAPPEPMSDRLTTLLKRPGGS